MKEFFEILLGDANASEFAAMMFFSLLAAVAMWLVMARTRNKESTRTPENWSWKFYWAENLKRQIGTVFLMFITLRLSQYSDWFKENGQLDMQKMVFVAIVVGLIADQLAMLFFKAKTKATTYIGEKIDDSTERLDSKIEEKSNKLENKIDEIKDSINDNK